MADENGSVNAGNPGEWTSALPADLKPVVETKGWKSPADALTGYVNLEKLVGTKRLEAPQENWDDAKWGEFHKSIGAPEDPNAYQFPESVKIEDEDFAKWSRETARELGLTNRQFAKLTEKWQGYVGGRTEAGSAAQAEQLAASDAALRKEWGGAYDQRIDAGKAAVKALQDKIGIDEEFLSTVEGKLGYAPLIKLFAVLAEDYGIGREGRAPGQGSMGITPDAASAELRQLQADEKFRDAFFDQSHPAHRDAVEKFNRLVELGGKTAGHAAMPR